MADALFSDLTVLCDEPADCSLFIALQKLSPDLAAISTANVRVYSSKLRGEAFDRVRPLMINDRPDFIFMSGNVPLLVVELTEHGYTGDNPLQRFTRLAAAAENGVPVVYFGPFARVRDDEMDLVDDPATLSKRRVNTDLFLGMSRLSEIHGVPLGVVEWITGANGKPLKVPHSDHKKMRTVFARLIDRICILLHYSLTDKDARDKLKKPLESIASELTSAHEVSNVRGSQTKIEMDASQAKAFSKSPPTILNRITPKGYYFKDKPERLLGMLCIQHSAIHHVVTRSHSVTVDELPDSGPCATFALCKRVRPSIRNGAFFYYTGYKWRSDPHCGVLVNYDYVHCRNNGALTPAERPTPLILFYPRIYYHSDSPNIVQLHQTLRDMDTPGTAFHNLFVQRYGARDAPARIDRFRTKTSGHTAQWSDTTKQSRIFRQYCDFIVLADAVILGDHLDFG